MSKTSMITIFCFHEHYNIDNYISPLLAVPVAILRIHDYKCAMRYWVNEVQNATYKFSTRRNLDSSSPGARVIKF